MVLVKNYALDGRGGGQALPPFLQGRTAAIGSQFQTRPMITPKSTVALGETKPKGAMDSLGKRVKRWITPAQPQVGPTAPGQPAITPANKPQGSTAQTLYDFFKRDLESQRKSAMSGAVADAARRGVYHGTPLTTSQGDIETEYLRGLGQLQAGILGNEQQNELQRLGIAAGLIGPYEQAQADGIDPDVFKTIGGLVGGGGQQAPVAQSAPQITPAANQPPAAPFQPQLPFRPGQQPSLPLKPFRPGFQPDGTFDNGIDPYGRPYR